MKAGWARLMVIGYWRTLSAIEVLLVIGYLVIGYSRTLSAAEVLLADTERSQSVIGFWQPLNEVLLVINFHKLSSFIGNSSFVIRNS
jgi:hypothetical protein